MRPYPIVRVSLNLDIRESTYPKIRARFADMGGTALGGSPADYQTFVADETEKWAKVIKFAGIKAQ